MKSALCHFHIESYETHIYYKTKITHVIFILPLVNSENARFLSLCVFNLIFFSLLSQYSKHAEFSRATLRKTNNQKIKTYGIFD